MRWEGRQRLGYISELKTVAISTVQNSLKKLTGHAKFAFRHVRGGRFRASNQFETGSTSGHDPPGSSPAQNGTATKAWLEIFPGGFYALEIGNTFSWHPHWFSLPNPWVLQVRKNVFLATFLGNHQGRFLPSHETASSLGGRKKSFTAPASLSDFPPDAISQALNLHYPFIALPLSRFQST